MRGDVAASNLWALFHVFQVALQRSRGLLPQRARTRLVAAGTAEVGMCHERVAWLGLTDDDLHGFLQMSADAPKTQRPGGSEATRAVQHLNRLRRSAWRRTGRRSSTEGFERQLQ